MSEERSEPVGDDADDGILDDLLGLEPDDPETESEEQQEPEQQPGEPEAPAPQPSRASRRVSALRNRLKDQEDENRRLRADIERMVTQTRQPAAPQPNPYQQAEMLRQEQERLAMMAPHEIAAYTEQKLRSEFNERLLRGQVETADMIDRHAFDNLKLTNALAARYADRVEAAVIQLRQAGQNFPRQVILKQLIGDEIFSKHPRQAEAARKRSARQIAAQTTQPGGGRSGAADTRRTTRRDDPDAGLDERLRNVTIGEAWNG